MDELLAVKATDAVINSTKSYCKFLSANDSGETGGHQSGYLVSKSVLDMMFSPEDIRKEHILKRPVKISWQDDFITDSCFTWYESKGELRITQFGRGFPFRGGEYTGALFVFVRAEKDFYKAYILNTEEDIQQFLDNFGMTPADTNRPIEINRMPSKLREQYAINSYIGRLDIEFPQSEEMSRAARMIYSEVSDEHQLAVTNPDKILVEWIQEEYTLFKALENDRYGSIVKKGFATVDNFIILANQVLNRRKSRAGKSLEHHLATLFDKNNIRYTAQGITEGKKRPDFIFPSEEDYHNTLFPIEKLCTLAAKTTCKDRWRQVLNEADRMKDQYKYLCTLQQGISEAQMDEMQDEGVILVVPKPYITAYPADRRERIWTVGRFIKYVQTIEEVH